MVQDNEGEILGSGWGNTWNNGRSGDPQAGNFSSEADAYGVHEDMEDSLYFTAWESASERSAFGGGVPAFKQGIHEQYQRI